MTADVSTAVRSPFARVLRWRAMPYVVPAIVTAVWLVYVLATDEFGRALDRWPSAVTMAFGSFLAGASPEGGGAVAFPVFTKVLHVPPAVARTFALSIQAVGMTAASIVILLTGRPVEYRAIWLGTGAGTLGLVLGLLVLGDSSTPFWESRLPAAYVKVTFTVMLSAMAFLMFQTRQQREYGSMEMGAWTPRIWAGLAVAAFIGGLLSSLIGTGLNALLFLFMVAMLGMHPRVAVPTSVVTMAAVSVVGFVILGLGHGQLDVVLNAGGEVVSVGGSVIDPEAASSHDLRGLWLAAVPIVVWGAPLGTYVVHRLREDWLVLFLGALATIEVLSTVVLVDALRSDLGLVIYGVASLTIAVGGIRLLATRRDSILGLD